MGSVHNCRSNDLAGVAGFSVPVALNALPGSKRATFYGITRLNRKDPRPFHEDLPQLFVLLAEGEILVDILFVERGAHFPPAQRANAMNTLEAIKERRSIRQFTDDPIGKDALEKLLDAARWAPTASNQQRRRFVVVTSPTVKELIKKFSPGIFVIPSAYIVICVEKAPDAGTGADVSYLADCAIAAQNILLAAYEMGIGSCLVLAFSKTAVTEVLNLPENVEPLLVVTLGFPAESPKPPARRELSQIAFLDEYGKEWTS
jgi:nitroreductase